MIQSQQRAIYTLSIELALWTRFLHLGHASLVTILTGYHGETKPMTIRVCISVFERDKNLVKREGKKKLGLGFCLADVSGKERPTDHCFLNISRLSFSCM